MGCEGVNYLKRAFLCLKSVPVWLNWRIPVLQGRCPSG